jgi:hypothetical protein
MTHDVKSSGASKKDAFSKPFVLALLHHHIAALLGFAITKPMQRLANRLPRGRIRLARPVLHLRHERPCRRVKCGQQYRS